MMTERVVLCKSRHDTVKMVVGGFESEREAIEWADGEWDERYTVKKVLSP